MPTAYTYFRFSSGSQATGSSIARQEHLVAQWLQRNPEYQLGDLQFIDRGRSGYSGAHLKYDLGRILTAIENKDIKRGDTILVEAVDRIGRLPPTEMIELILSITRSGVSIVTIDDNKIYTKDSLDTDQSALFILVGKVQQAHEYSKLLGSRVRAGYQAKRQKAKQGETVNRITPFWLTTFGELIPENAAAVKACIDLYLRGYGPRKILEKLESEHPKLEQKHPSTVVRWLKSRALCGDWVVYKTEDNPPGRPRQPSEIIKDVYPPLIDRATFYDIQHQLKLRSRQGAKEVSYELSGLCLCGECGGAFYYRRKPHKGETIIYSNCSTYLKRGIKHCSTKKTWPYEVLLHIHDTTNHFHIQAATEIEDAREASKEQVVKEGELEEVERKLNNTRQLLIDFKDDQGLRDAYTELTETASDLKAEISRLAQTENTPVITNFFDEVTDDPVMLNATLKEIGYRIVINGSEASVDCGGAILRYTLLRRSQRYHCYIVHHQSLPEAFEELGFISTEDWDYHECYLAINRQGLIAEAKTDQDLINKLKDLKSHNSIV